jgi:hypothetical protein
MFTGARFLKVCILAAVATFSSQVRADARAAGPVPMVWLSAVDDMPAPKGFQVDQDYHQLFEAGAPWQRALARVQGFEITRRSVQTQPEEKLRKMFAFLSDHHIALGVSFGVIPARNNCGDNVEGMLHNANANLVTARRVKQLGGNLKYIGLDEPFFFGHYFVGTNGKVGCRYSIEELASAYGVEINKIRSVFPDAQVIEDEPTEGLESPSELGRWIDQLKHELGAGAPQSIRFDVQWHSRKRPWREAAQALVATVRQHGLGYGVIFDGTGQDQTDEDWIRSAEGNISAWESVIPEVPDHVMIQSWYPHPQKLLPESSPTTLPYLVNWYCRNARMAHGCQ